MLLFSAGLLGEAVSLVELSHVCLQVWEALPEARPLCLLNWSFLQLSDPQSSTPGLGEEGSAAQLALSPAGPHTPFPNVDVDDASIEVFILCTDLMPGSLRVDSVSFYLRTKANSLSRVRLFVTPMNCSIRGSSIYGIFQARVLAWVAVSFPRGSS